MCKNGLRLWSKCWTWNISAWSGPPSLGEIGTQAQLGVWQLRRLRLRGGCVTNALEDIPILYVFCNGLFVAGQLGNHACMHSARFLCRHQILSLALTDEFACFCKKGLSTSKYCLHMWAHDFLACRFCSCNYQTSGLSLFNKSQCLPLK